MVTKHRGRGRKIDWARVERDYATGKFTDQELAERHGTARAVICRRRGADRSINPTAWAIDLRADITRATAALLLREQVTGKVARGIESEAVMAAAEMTKQVILGHRADIRHARALSSTLMAELADVSTARPTLAAILTGVSSALDEIQLRALAAQVTELTKLHSRVGSLQKLSDAMTKLQGLERKAFGISDTDGGSDPLATMTDAELRAEIARLEGLTGTSAVGLG